MKALPLTLASIRADASGLMVVRPLYQTHDPAAFDRALSTVGDALKGTPKLRPPTRGNRRPVRVFSVDVDAITEQVRAGTLAKGYPVGHTFPTVQDASAALGLSPASLRQLFCAARKSNGGTAAPVTVRGHSLEYADTRDTVAE